MSYYIGSNIGRSYYISHHGVVGQRWGIRRFQYRDGSLTAAGRKHYGYESSRAEGTNSVSPKAWDGSLTPDIVSALKSKRNEAIFYTGCVKFDKAGNVTMSSTAFANRYAEKNKGVTIATLLSNADKNIPEWDFSDADSVQSWKFASKSYAEQASGSVRVVARQPLRKGNIFETVELPTLKKNSNVTSITMIDPDTGKKTVIFRRSGSITH